MVYDPGVRRQLGTIAVCLAIALAMTGCSSSTTAEVGDAARPTTGAAEPTAAPEPSTPEPPAPEPPSPNTPQPDNPTGRVVVLLDSGAEPRITLQPAPATSTITVTATEDSDTTFGTVSDQQSFFGDYDLELTTAAAASGFTLITDRTVRTLDTDAPPPDVGAIVGFRQNYTSAGLPIFVLNTQEDAYRRLSGGLLSTPNVLLAAPTEAVGVGAQWTIPLDRTGDDVAQVTLLAITDSTLEISLSFERTSDEGTFSMTADGTYDRTSLLAHNVTTVSALTLETEASENGQLVPVRNSRDSVRIYRAIPS